jgi:hypothetical protein
MPKPRVTIENWGVVQNIISLSFEELHPGNRLTGYVLGHPSLPNTTRIFTSPILSIDLSQGVVETLNTMYQLGETSDEYKSWRTQRGAAAAA